MTLAPSASVANLELPSWYKTTAPSTAKVAKSSEPSDFSICNVDAVLKYKVLVKLAM